MFQSSCHSKSSSQVKIVFHSKHYTPKVFFWNILFCRSSQLWAGHRRKLHTCVCWYFMYCVYTCVFISFLDWFWGWGLRGKLHAPATISPEKKSLVPFEWTLFNIYYPYVQMIHVLAREWVMLCGGILKRFYRSLRATGCTTEGHVFKGQRPERWSFDLFGVT